MQVAHPLVAAGVANHSNFQKDPLSRFVHTLELMHTLVFGRRREVEQMLRRFNAVHKPVKGHLSHASGPFPAGTQYDANDPQLKLWVQATLIDTSLLAYQRFVGPLTAGERQSYYADSLVLAQLMGVPQEVLPPTLEEFYGYMEEMLASDALAVTDRARMLQRSVFDPGNVSLVPYASARVLRFVAAGLLPERLRRAYRLQWDGRKQVALDALSRTLRLVRPVSPAWVWQSPMLGGGLPRFLMGEIMTTSYEV
jgi:uncharacterized protein (DUF2236 family)